MLQVHTPTLLWRNTRPVLLEQALRNTHTQIYTHTYIYIYKHGYTNTHMHTHTHTTTSQRASPPQQRSRSADLGAVTSKCALAPSSTALSLAMQVTLLLTGGATG